MRLVRDERLNTAALIVRIILAIEFACKQGESFAMIAFSVR
jgi:hypothetical protein